MTFSSQGCIFSCSSQGCILLAGAQGSLQSAGGCCIVHEPVTIQLQLSELHIASGRTGKPALCLGLLHRA